jgi:hypothetical protein
MTTIEIDHSFPSIFTNRLSHPMEPRRLVRSAHSGRSGAPGSVR